MSEEEPHQHGRPTEGMCCLCTMEDITDEDQNYGEDFILLFGLTSFNLVAMKQQ
jgi:hypothetical protein